MLNINTKNTENENNEKTNKIKELEIILAKDLTSMTVSELSEFIEQFGYNLGKADKTTLYAFANLAKVQVENELSALKKADNVVKNGRKPRKTDQNVVKLSNILQYLIEENLIIETVIPFYGSSLQFVFNDELRKQFDCPIGWSLFGSDFSKTNQIGKNLIQFGLVCQSAKPIGQTVYYNSKNHGENRDQIAKNNSWIVTIQVFNSSSELLESLTEKQREIAVKLIEDNYLIGENGLDTIKSRIANRNSN